MNQSNQLFEMQVQNEIQRIGLAIINKQFIKRDTGYSNTAIHEKRGQDIFPEPDLVYSPRDVKWTARWYCQWRVDPAGWPARFKVENQKLRDANQKIFAPVQDKIKATRAVA